MGRVGPNRITVFLADDNVIVREGVRALLGLEDPVHAFRIDVEEIEEATGE